MEAEQEQEKSQDEQSAIGGQALDRGDLPADARSRITELEAALTARDAEIAVLREAKGGLETRAQGLDRSLSEAVAGYRGMVLAANPDVPPELIKGETLEAIGESLKQARVLVGKVRKGLEAELARERFPAGAPGRGGGGQELTPGDKIRQGIAR